MSNIQNYLITLSLICWLVIVVFEVIKNKWRYSPVVVFQLIIIIISIIILNRYFGYFNTTEFKGSKEFNENLIILFLYLSTVLGIIGHYVFFQIKNIHEKGRQKKLKWMPLIKPLIISPIIFLAVLYQLEHLSVQANGTTVVLTQCLLAFQNGFFWKAVVEKVE